MLRFLALSSILQPVDPNERYRRRRKERRQEVRRRRLIAAEIMRAVYFETLRRIERSDYDVFNARLRVPRPWQAVIALREWLRPV